MIANGLKLVGLTAICLVTLFQAEASAQAPVIATHPANRSASVGDKVRFWVEVSGNPAPVYTWQSGGGSYWTNLPEGSIFSGTATAALTINVSGFTGTYTYRVVITNSFGQVISAPATMTVPAPVRRIATGGNHTCGLTSGNGVSCWGYNAFGELGDGTTTARGTPAAVTGLASGVTAMATGLEHSCAVVGGSARCWGRNSGGQLGDGTRTDRFTPVPVGGVNHFHALALGADFTCGLTPQNVGSVVQCWGANSDGQLGDGTSTDRQTPAAVSPLTNNVLALATGSGHACAISTAGAVLCWGRNSSGQLGDGTTSLKRTPVAVSGLSSEVKAIAAGGHHSCAVNNAGGVVCWGANGLGQLGDGTGVNSLTPVAVSGLSSGVTAITAGQYHTCALTALGAVLCWGYNDAGELGDGTTANRLAPVAVNGLSADVAAVAAGNFHTCAISQTVGAVCWGYNGFGQTGDGATTNRFLPVGVTGYGLVRFTPETLQFAATKSGATLVAVTAAQAVRATVTGIVDTWTANASQPWLQLSGASGTGTNQFTAAIVNPGDVIGTATTLTATITVTSTRAGLTSSSTLPVTLTVAPAATAVPPFGTLDTPGPGFTYSGSIPVTGWALDNVGVTRVELWRDRVGGESTPVYGGGGPGNGKIFIANMAFVPGARPDVEALYPTLPQASRGGWGYLMLTYGLWNQGTGTYTLHAFAYDEEGNSAALGSKTFTSDNSAAVRPFGALDTPDQGQTVTGSFWNFGWALTPNATPSCTIGPNGVQVRIDSGPLLPVTFGDFRSDVESGFPGYTNTTSSGGAHYIDTSALASGTHQIGWLVTDSCGRGQGIGSRFFSVANSSSRAATAPADDSAARAGATTHDVNEAIEIRRDTHVSVVDSNPLGYRVVPIDQGEHVEVQLPVNEGTYTGYSVVNGSQRQLPLGSSFNSTQGRFYWEPAPGFLGAHDLEFASTTGGRVRVRAVIGTSVQAVIDTPQPGRQDASSVTISGWAIDEAARTGSGIDTVHVWAYPVAGGAPLFLGVAAYGGARPDIGTLFGAQFTGASYHLVADGLPPGTYDIVVYPHSAVTGDFRGAQVVRVTIQEPRR